MAKIGPQHAQLLLTHFLAPHRPPEVLNGYERLYPGILVGAKELEFLHMSASYWKVQANTGRKNGGEYSTYLQHKESRIVNTLLLCQNIQCTSLTP